MASIYEEIWKADESRCSVGVRTEGGDFDRPDADVLLDQQVAAGGRRNVDLAARPLFARVREEALERPTYRAFIGLLDNYVVNFRRREDETPAERAEIDAFLGQIVPTAPMRLAFDHITGTLGERLADEAAFRQALYTVWFEPYTNHFNGRRTEFCSGFEHVFVGEGQYDENRGGPVLGEISGYHSWVKFHLDERAGRVNFLGYKYDLQGSPRPTSPNVVTLQMLWEHKDMAGGPVAQLFKKKGGFFVGPSPECEIAMGTVAFYESLRGAFHGEKLPVTIDEDRYNLVLYRDTEPSGARGRHIRSFYPEFLGTRRGAQPPIGDTVVRPGSTNPGPVAIVSAVINPPGEDEGKEVVELKNVSPAEISLEGWRLEDNRGGRQALSGRLPAGGATTVPLQAGPGGMLLGNKSGSITLLRGEERVATVSYRRVRSGQSVAFPVG